jgi:hypothetical protein
MVMTPAGLRTKNDCVGDGQQQFTRPTKAGSNTSTVALRDVGGDKNGTPCPGGYNWATLFLGDALQVGGVSNLRQ